MLLFQQLNQIKWRSLIREHWHVTQGTRAKKSNSNATLLWQQSWLVTVWVQPTFLVLYLATLLFVSVLGRRKTLFADKSWAAFVPLSSQLRRRKSDWRTPNYFWWEKGTVIYWSCCNRRTTPFLLAVFFAAKGENCQISFRDRQDKHCRSSQCAAIVILQKQAIFRSHRPLECVNYFRRSSLILLDANQPKDKPFRIRSSLCLLLVLLLKKSSLITLKCAQTCPSSVHL